MKNKLQHHQNIKSIKYKVINYKDGWLAQEAINRSIFIGTCLIWNELKRKQLRFSVKSTWLFG